jgi:tyrosyl-tRNA synthetase
VFQRGEVPGDVPVAAFDRGFWEGREVLRWYVDGELTDATEFTESPFGQYRVDGAELLVACRLTTTKSEAKRLLLQGAVEVEGAKITDRHITFEHGSVVRVGPRRFVKLIERQEG